MKTNTWTEEEKNCLLDLIDSTHRAEIAAVFRREAEINGWKIRSDIAIKGRLRRLRPWAKPIDNNFNTPTLAEILKYKTATVRRWVSTKKLRGTRIGTQVKIKTAAIKSFAERYPSLLKCADYDGLVFLVGEALADEIKVSPWASGKKKKVLNKQTGQVFNSVTAAAKATNYSRSGFRKLAKNNQQIWELIECA